MDDVVAVAIELGHGTKRYFLTFGRIQDSVDPEPLADLVLGRAHGFSLGGVPAATTVCGSLREAADSTDAPYFYESLLSISRVVIPFGDGYASWRSHVDEQMRAGKHLYYCGTPT